MRRIPAAEAAGERTADSRQRTALALDVEGPSEPLKLLF